MELIKETIELTLLENASLRRIAQKEGIDVVDTEATTQDRYISPLNKKILNRKLVILDKNRNLMRKTIANEANWRE